MNTSKSLDELDEILYMAESEAIAAAQLNPDDPIYILSHNSAKQAIVEAVEGLIGADEDEGNEDEAYKRGRNRLRAELRQAIKEWQ